MANTIQIKRGLEADRSSVTPAAGELLYTTDDKKVYVGDGTTAGGNPVAAGGASIEATASGALANGDIVVVNSDGTVSVVAGRNQTTGTPVVFENASSSYCSVTYDSANGKVVIAYADGGNSSYGTAIVGTVSGTSISFGTPVVFESASTTHISSTYDSTNSKVVIAYADGGNSSYGTAIIGTVSGTGISFGSAAVFESSATTFISSTYDTNAQKVVIAYSKALGSWGTAIVGTVSGTSISFGTSVVFEYADTDYIAAVYDANAQKVVIAYADVGSFGYGTAIVGTVSGTSISFGTAVTFLSSNTYYVSAAYNTSAQKVVIAYKNAEISYLYLIVGTVSGTSISFGTANANNINAEYISITYDENADKVVVSYRDNGNSSRGTAVVGTVSGTSISIGTPVVFESGHALYISSAYDASAQNIVIAYADLSNSYYGTATVLQNESENLTASNYIGISDGAYADASTATIQIVGAVNDAQTGLTAGQAYYVQSDGTLSTTPDTPSVFAGTAISSTQLIVKG